MGPVCVSSEFVCLARGTTSPVTEWLRKHARALHDDVGGPGVGVIGMCLTGGFALAMMVDPVVVAPVLSQPSLPLPISRRHRRDLGISDRDLKIVKERAAGGCDVLGLRFTGDTMAPGARFQRLRDELGDHFIAVEIDSSAGNPHGIPRSAHSVVTNDLTDEPGHPTRDALDTVLGFFRERLHVDR
jgi:dienelactone hydrolase